MIPLLILSFSGSLVLWFLDPLVHRFYGSVSCSFVLWFSSPLVLWFYYSGSLLLYFSGSLVLCVCYSGSDSDSSVLISSFSVYIILCMSIFHCHRVLLCPNRLRTFLVILSSRATNLLGDLSLSSILLSKGARVSLEKINAYFPLKITYELTHCIYISLTMTPLQFKHCEGDDVLTWKKTTARYRISS